MKKKVVWLSISVIIVITMVLAACAPAATPTLTPTPTPTPTASPTPTPRPTLTAEPQYGGTLTALHLHAGLEPQTWDPADYNWVSNPFLSPYMENLRMGDLNKGPRGSNEYGFVDLEYIPPQFATGQLAESWEMPDAKTIIVHLRKGVMFPNKPGVMTARELTSADVVFSLDRLVNSPKAAGYRRTLDSATAPDKYTVVLKYLDVDVAATTNFGWGYFVGIYPQELVKAGISDWKNAVGSGPFITGVRLPSVARSTSYPLSTVWSGPSLLMSPRS